jgi:hypothetical protein
MGQRRRLAHKKPPPELAEAFGGRPSRPDFNHHVAGARPMTAAAVGKWPPFEPVDDWHEQ